MNLHIMDFNESERTDYLMVVASMAGADGSVTSEEIFALRQLSLEFVLGPEARGRVMASTTTPLEQLDDTLGRLADSDLRYSLLLDVAAMAHRDGQFSEAESSEYAGLSRRLGVSDKHSDAILEYASCLFAPGYTPAKACEHLEKLVSSGVSRRVVSLSASMAAMGVNSQSGIHH